MCFKQNNFVNLTGYLEQKVGALINMSQCLKASKNYVQARSMAWRALEFCLYLKDSSREFEIYDLLGRIHFLEGRLIEAEFYHKVAMSATPDSSQGLVNSAIVNCQNSLKNRTLVRSNITLEVLYFMDFSFFFMSLVSKEFSEDQKRMMSDSNLPSLGAKSFLEGLKSSQRLQKLQSGEISFARSVFEAEEDTSIASLLSQFSRDSEFESQPAELNVDEEKKKFQVRHPDKVQKEMEFEARSIRMAKAKHSTIRMEATGATSFSKWDMPRKPEVFKGFTKKLSLEEELELVSKRNITQSSTEFTEKVIQRNKKKSFGGEKDKRFFISHLSPNRSIFEFEHHFHPDYNVVNEFFRTLILHFASPN